MNQNQETKTLCVAHFTLNISIEANTETQAAYLVAHAKQLLHNEGYKVEP